MKILLPNFRVIYRPEASNKDWELAEELEIKKVKAYNVFRQDHELVEWIDYPFPLVLFDKVVVDRTALEYEIAGLERDSMSARSREFR